MALNAQEQAKLLTDFRSGRNKSAFLHLCREMRRERRYSEALDLCKQGLAQGETIAGRVMQARLLSDLGRHEEGVRALDAAASSLGPKAGLYAEKARCLFALNQIEEAEEALEKAEELDPTDALAQAIRGELREARRLAPKTRAPRRTPAQMSMEEVGETLKRQIDGIGRVLSLALLDLDTGKSFVEGETDILEMAEVLHMEAAEACQELSVGELASTTVEFTDGWLLILRRQRRMAVLVFESDASFGKWHHRVHMVIDQLMNN